MNKVSILIIFFLSLTFNAQKGRSISVTGDIIKPLNIQLDDLTKYNSYSLDSLAILNHKMEYKSTLKNLKGVLLKDVLQQVEFLVKSPKQLSEFYIVCIADDNYKVVFSWNELFNSATGDKAMIVTDNSHATDGKGLILITPTDKATGRRYVKDFSKVLIQQVK